MANLRVVVADDQKLMREAVRMVLSAEDGMTVVGEAASGAALLDLLKRVQPDVALVDLAMPPLDGIELLERIRAEHSGVKTVVLSGTDDRRQVAAALRRGAAAFILKSVNPLDLPAIIRQVVDGTTFVPVPRDVELRADARGTLSDRELAVLVELAEGRTNKEIAGRLWVSEETVKFHLRNIYRKLAVSSRTDAIRFAHENDLVGVGL